MDKEIELDFNGRPEKFVLKPLTFGEKNRLIEESTDIKLVNGQQLVKVSVSKLIEGAILKCLVKAPFVINLDNIQGLDVELGRKLSEIVTELNNLDEKKNEK